jgi:hypothetical protein
MDFQSIPLEITYSFQHFEPIEYVNGLSKKGILFRLVLEADHRKQSRLLGFSWFWDVD